MVSRAVQFRFTLVLTYGDQGINTEEYEKTIYGNLMQTQSDE